MYMYEYLEVDATVRARCRISMILRLEMISAMPDEIGPCA